MYRAGGTGSRVVLRMCRACGGKERGPELWNWSWGWRGQGAGGSAHKELSGWALLGSTWLSAVSQPKCTNLFSSFTVTLPLDLTCLRFDVTSVRQMGTKISSKRNSAPSSSSSSDNRPHTPTQNLGEKIVAFINVRPTGPHCFYSCYFFAHGYRSNKFPGKWNSLIRFPSIKFHIRNEKNQSNWTQYSCKPIYASRIRQYACIAACMGFPFQSGRNNDFPSWYLMIQNIP